MSAALPQPGAVSWEGYALQVMAEEYSAALPEANQPKAVRESTLRYYERYQWRESRLPAEGEPPACKAGCSYCCHLRVSAPAHEVLTLARAIGEMTDADRRAQITARIHENARTIHAMPSQQHWSAQLRCALLGDDGTCSAYESRPSSCRRYHSVSLQDCKTSHDAPENLNSRIRLSTPHLVLNMSQYLGFRKALGERGLDTGLYELTTALSEALDDLEGCADRHARGEPPFRQAIVAADIDQSA